MAERDLVDRLAEHRTLGGAPRCELEWIASHATLRQLAVGEVLSVKGSQVEALYIILSGRLALFVDRGSGLNRVIEWRSGDVAGLLPYSRLMAPPGDSLAQEPLEILYLHRDQFRELTRECFEVTSILVHTMLDRTRMFTSSDLQNEKMISLGKLSAGLAHELNNPASAIERCGAILRDRLDDAEQATRGLAEARLTREQLTAVEALRSACLAKQSEGVRSPLEQSDREEAMAGWLAQHGLDTKSAAMLADTEVTFDLLDQLALMIDGPALDPVLRWAAAGCAVRNLTSKIQSSATHVSRLIKAVKGFTHMDQANIAEPVDLRRSLSETVAVLQSKALDKSVSIKLDLEEQLPRVRGFAGELNQVWSNLIDNALDAAPMGGHVDLRAARDGHKVLVRVIDNGSGIAKEIRARIFDPFFTTKPQGQGTGLGLDIVWRLVRHNDGSIDFDSKPGRTEFRVRLPIAEGQSPVSE